MEEIKCQLVFLCGSFLSGITVMFFYEFIGVLRRIFGLRTVGKLVWDLLFFAVSGVMVFRMIFLCNQGMLRSFFVFAFGAGAILYRHTFGTKLSDGIVKGFHWGTRQVMRPFHWFCKKFSKKP